MKQSICIICSTNFEGRRDRRWCSQDCRREIKRTYDRERYPEVRSDTISRACAWQIENRKRKQIYDAERRVTNADRIIEIREAYKLVAIDNPEQRRLTTAKRRARKRGNGSFVVTPRDLARLLARHGGCCAYCMGEFTAAKPLEWDHVIPIVRGGSHSIGNLLPACRKCNRAKQVKLLTEWRAGRVVWAGAVSQV